MSKIPQHPMFYRYEHIPHLKVELKRSNPWLSTMIVATEKIDGKQFRVGYINGEYMFGSRKEQLATLPFKDIILTHNLMRLIKTIGDGVVVYGELFGSSISRYMDYGTVFPRFAVFDISVKGRYIDWVDTRRLCHKHDVKTVPVIYMGWLSEVKVKTLSTGPTMLASEQEILGGFKGMEGVVLRPTKEVAGFKRARAKIISQAFKEYKIA